MGEYSSWYVHALCACSVPSRVSVHVATRGQTQTKTNTSLGVDRHVFLIVQGVRVYTVVNKQDNKRIQIRFSLCNTNSDHLLIFLVIFFRESLVDTPLSIDIVASSVEKEES